MSVQCIYVSGWMEGCLDWWWLNRNKLGSLDKINWKSVFRKVCIHSWVSDRTSVGVEPLPLAVMVTALWPNYLPSFPLNILAVQVKNLSVLHHLIIGPLTFCTACSEQSTLVWESSVLWNKPSFIVQLIFKHDRVFVFSRTLMVSIVSSAHCRSVSIQRGF